jgi:glycosyltransferase involved in cell wall biosynthesis
MRIASVLLTNFKNDNRVFRIADSLQSKGHEVKIVAWKKGDVEEYENFNGVNVHRIVLKWVSWKSKSKWFGAIRILEFFYRSIKLYRKYDAWHCNDFEAFMVGRVAKMFNPKLKLVYDCHEYETERYGKSKLERRVTAFLERRTIHKADVVITVGPSIRKEYIRLYGLKEVFLLRNTPHKMSFPKGEVFREKFGIRKDQMIFLYQGMLAGGRGVEVLLETFLNRKSDDAVVVFMGYGNMEQPIREAAEKSPIIFLHPAVPYEQIFSFTCSADVGLNTPQNHCLSYYYCMPNKLFEYIQAGIPVLTNDLPDCRELVLTEGVGEVIPHYDVHGVNEAIALMQKKSLQSYTPALNQAKEKLHWDNEVKVLFEAYSRIGG